MILNKFIITLMAIGLLFSTIGRQSIQETDAIFLGVWYLKMGRVQLSLKQTFIV
jgi:hypothetical protein